MEANLSIAAALSCSFALYIALGLTRGRSYWQGEDKHAARALLDRWASVRLVGKLAQAGFARRAICAIVEIARAAKHSLSEREAAGLLCAGWAGVPLVLGLVSWSLAGVVMGMVLVVSATPSLVAVSERMRKRQLSSEMPQIMRSLAVALSSGKTLPQAIEYIGRSSKGIAAGEFAQAALEMRCGSSIERVLCDLERRLDAPGVELLASSLVISQRTGCPLRELLLTGAQLVEEGSELQRSLQTKTAQARLSVRIVCTMPLLLVVVLVSISPEFRQGVTSSVGSACLVIAALLDGLAIFIIRRQLKAVML